MSWTKTQLGLAHIAMHQVGWEDPQYRLVLQNVAGIRRYNGKISGTNPTADNAGFERYMAFAEKCGFVDSKNGRGYWSQEVQKQVARIHWRIREIAKRAVGACLIGPDALDGFVERQTHSRPIEEGGPTRKLEDCDAIWSYKVLEGLKGWLFRAAKQRGIHFDLREDLQRKGQPCLDGNLNASSS